MLWEISAHILVFFVVKDNLLQQKYVSDYHVSYINVSNISQVEILSGKKKECIK